MLNDIKYTARSIPNKAKPWPQSITTAIYITEYGLKNGQVYSNKGCVIYKSKNNQLSYKIVLENGKHARFHSAYEAASAWFKMFNQGLK
jgi:hypothetical protein